MEQNNLELYKQFSFDEIVEHGFKNNANIVNGMPWSWKINGKSITHENNFCYIVETIEGMKEFGTSEKIMAAEHGLVILRRHNTHAPGGCPL